MSRVSVLRTIVLIAGGFLCGSGPSARPVDPWPPAFILQRGADAACEVEDLVHDGTKRAREKKEEAEAKARERIDSAEKKAQKAQEERDEGNNYKWESGNKRTEFSLDVPEVAVSWNETEIPSVELTMKVMTLGVPTIGRCPVGSTKVPEFSGYRVTMKRREITVACPKIVQASLKVPVFEETRMKLRLPEIRTEMKTRKFAFHAPQVTIRDQSDQQRKAEKEVANAQSWLTTALDEIARGEKARTAEAVRQVLKTIYDEALAEITAIEEENAAERREQFNQIVTARNEAVTTLAAVGASLDNRGDIFSEASNQLQANESTIRESTQASIALLNQIFNDLVTRYLGPVTDKIGSGPFCDRTPGKPAIVLPQ